MARNGSGTYSLPQPPFTPGTTIASSAVNSDLSDIGAALTQSISKDGQTVYTGNQPMGGNKLTGLGAGTSPNDSVRLSQVSDGSINYGGVAGGTADDITLAPVPGISAYAVGQTFTFKAAADNTGAMTADVSTVGAGDLTWPDGTAMAAGDIQEDGVYEIAVADITTPTAPILHLQTNSKPPLPRTGGTMTGLLVMSGSTATVTMSGAAINEAKGSDIASASTINLTTATGNVVDLTGTTTVTAITLGEGMERVVRATAATLLTNGASLVLLGGANITTAAGDFMAFRGYAAGVVRMEWYQRANGQPVTMSPITASLGSDVAMPSTGTYYTGPSIAQGTSGTWFVSGSVTVAGPVGGDIVNVKLWDGTTVIDSCRMHLVSVAGTYYGVAGLSGYIASPAGNLRISVSPVARTDNLIAYNASGNAKDSTITAIRIA